MVDHVRFGYDLGSSGFNPVEDGTGAGNNIRTDSLQNLTILAQSPVLNGKVQTQVLVVGSYAYVNTVDGTFYKLNKDTLAVVATYAIGAACHSTPHIVSGIAYFGDDAGFFHAVTVSTMAQLWKTTPAEPAAILTHPVVVAGSSRVWFASNRLRAVNTATGAFSWASTAVGGAAKGALAYADTRVFVATSAGVYAVVESTGVVDHLYGARAQVAGVAIQTAPGGQRYLCFESEDSWWYAYDLDTDDRIWMHFSPGKESAPVGMNLAAGYIVGGTHNWRISPHKYEGGAPRWIRDGKASSAVVAGFSIANGIFFGVWPVSGAGGDGDGRIVGFILDQSPGGHVSNWRFGTYTGIDGVQSSLNKGNICTPTIVNHRLYWGADDKIVYCFS